MKRIYLNCVLVITALCFVLTTYSAEFIRPITFAHGKSSTTIKGDVVRGDRDVYLIKVHSGQVMSVKVSTPENNAAFSIYEPKSEDAIPGTEEENDLANWSGTLSKTGEYRIIVGGTRGNASYKLEVSVK